VGKKGASEASKKDSRCSVGMVKLGENCKGKTDVANEASSLASMGGLAGATVWRLKNPHCAKINMRELEGEKKRPARQIVLMALHAELSVGPSYPAGGNGLSTLVVEIYGDGAQNRLFPNRGNLGGQSDTFSPPAKGGSKLPIGLSLMSF